MYFATFFFVVFGGQEIIQSNARQKNIFEVLNTKTELSIRELTLEKSDISTHSRAACFKLHIRLTQLFRFFFPSGIPVE